MFSTYERAASSFKWHATSMPSPKSVPAAKTRLLYMSMMTYQSAQHKTTFRSRQPMSSLLSPSTRFGSQGTYGRENADTMGSLYPTVVNQTLTISSFHNSNSKNAFSNIPTNLIRSTCHTCVVSWHKLARKCKLRLALYFQV